MPDSASPADIPPIPVNAPLIVDEFLYDPSLRSAVPHGTSEGGDDHREPVEPVEDQTSHAQPPGPDTPGASSPSAQEDTTPSLAAAPPPRDDLDVEEVPRDAPLPLRRRW